MHVLDTMSGGLRGVRGCDGCVSLPNATTCCMFHFVWSLWSLKPGFRNWFEDPGMFKKLRENSRQTPILLISCQNDLMLQVPVCGKPNKSTTKQAAATSMWGYKARKPLNNKHDPTDDQATPASRARWFYNLSNAIWIVLLIALVCYSDAHWLSGLFTVSVFKLTTQPQPHNLSVFSYIFLYIFLYFLICSYIFLYVFVYFPIFSYLFCIFSYIFLYLLYNFLYFLIFSYIFLYVLYIFLYFLIFSYIFLYFPIFPYIFFYIFLYFFYISLYFFLFLYIFSHTVSRSLFQPHNLSVSPPAAAMLLYKQHIEQT